MTDFIFAKKKKEDYEREKLFKVKKVPYKKDDMRLIKMMLKSLGKKRKTGASFSHGFSAGGKYTSGFDKAKKIDKSQRVTFKMSYGKNIHTHKVFLNHYMPQENKENVLDKPKLFGTPEAEYNEALSDLHFKCIISPENSNVDLEVLCNEFIKRVEHLTGYRLLWRGSIHTDTAHKHAHIAINGIDANGKEIRFPKEMIKKSMREILQYVATQMLGERTEEEIKMAKTNSLQSNRWTKVDDEIEMLGTVFPERFTNDLQKQRLAHLSKIGLAKFQNGNYVINEDWKETLVAAGRYNTYLEEYLKGGKVPLELYAGGGISGIVERTISFDKDESWNDALVINTGNRRVYVPVWQLYKTNLEGKTVEIKAGTEKLSRQVSNKDIHVVKRNNRDKHDR